MTLDKIRFDLEVALRQRGVDLSTASKAIGRNHAYLQQFVRTGKPRYLNEQDRAQLVLLYGIDPKPLIPPPKELPKDIGESPAGIVSRPPRVGDPIQDAREATIVDTWRKMAKEDQDALIGLLNGALRARGMPPIAV